MKQLVCEMCGGTDLVKEEGVFVCQSCGTKYSVEEARRLMIEGTVDVTGSTVKVDNTGKLDNLYILARRAKDDNDVEKATQYYEQIQLDDPNNWEAAFYSTYYSAIRKWRNDEERSAVDVVLNCVESVFGLIKANVIDEEEKISAGMEVAKQLQTIVGSFYQSNMSSMDAFWERFRAGSTRDMYEYLNATLLHRSSINFDLSKIESTLAMELLQVLDSESVLDKAAESFFEAAIETIQAEPCNYIFEQFTKDPKPPSFPEFHVIKKSGISVAEEKKRLIQIYRNCQERVEEKKERVAKQRITDYWIAHQSEKASLDSERVSLTEQIAALNEEVLSTPQNTEGYASMLELQKKLESLEVEKKGLGMFKLKEKKAVQEQIDATGSEIAPIQARIDAAVQDVKNRIVPVEKRIAEIDEELTKPR